MKVICTNISGKGDDITSNGWIVVGQEYVVIGVYGIQAKIKFRLLSSRQFTPALHCSTQFRITDYIVPPGWLFDNISIGNWCLEPKEFAQKGFWEDFFDGDPLAVSTFKEVAEALGAM